MLILWMMICQFEFLDGTVYRVASWVAQQFDLTAKPRHTIPIRIIYYKLRCIILQYSGFNPFCIVVTCNQYVFVVCLSSCWYECPNKIYPPFLESSIRNGLCPVLAFLVWSPNSWHTSHSCDKQCVLCHYLTCVFGDSFLLMSENTLSFTEKPLYR